ncbi:MAG: ABC transporter permease [Anaerolineae bacterium]|nr:ABC transporter permease [Anaerolineae bacterium]MBT7073580.1 ABC transporter permease [Anaerolineae bacterium]MBT7782124.1 ABC transporter permease [Anaerolineae bacterium]
MRKIISIAFLYLRTTYTSIGTLLFTIAMPIIFTFVLALTMKGMAGEPTPEAWQLLIANEDKSNLSASLIMHLEENPILDVEIAEKNSTLADVESGDALALLLIPSGFETNAFQHDATDLTLYQSADSIARAQILEEAVKSASAEIGGSLAIADLSLRVAEEIALINKSDEDGKQDYKEEAFEAAQSAWQTDEIINLQFTEATRLENGDDIPVGATQSSPGMLVMYALFFSFGGGATLLVERDEGTLRRLLVMPLSKSAIMGGKLLGIYLGALIQMTIMILFGILAFDLQWGQSPVGLIMMLLSYGFASTALGIMVAALSKSVAQANAAGTIVVMALASLGGAWWPIEIVPIWMQNLALMLPTGWAMHGFQDLLLRGLGLEAILPTAAILLRVVQF